jgi:hypothetical protein
MYVERTSYWAKPGKAVAVLDVRRCASRMRIGLGLPAGTIFVKVSAASDGPDVQWECQFNSLEEATTDLTTRDASLDFQRIREKMRTLIARFERHLVRQDVPE